MTNTTKYIKPPLRVHALLKEDFDFLSAYEWKRTKQRELMCEFLNIIRSNPDIPKSIFMNAFKGAHAFAFQDEDLGRIQEEQENTRKHLLEGTEATGQK